MYYIVNHTNHIIAADNDLLELLSVENIDDLYKKIALGDITLSSPSDKEVFITSKQIKTSYNTQKHILTGMLGKLTLVEINLSQESNTSLDEANEVLISTQKDDDIFILDNEPITFNDEAEKIADTETPTEEISFLKEESQEKPFDLISEEEDLTDEEPAISIAEETSNIQSEPAPQVDISPILIDIEDVSQKIGISTEDYNNFLNEYIDTALTLESDLKSTEEKKRVQAISTLSHLSNVLHLPVISNIIDDIQNSTEDAQSIHIVSLYNTLARLTTAKEASTEGIAELQLDDAPIVEENKEKPTKTISTGESFGSIDLSDVKPIHFDFQMEEAANDLSLPVELIEEFVQDFLVQAHEETDKMLKAYEEGDLDTIQKLGHLLKGTASNLRINPLADTLYEIQFCEDSSKLEDLIKEYWGHFLSFETQINLTSK